LALVSGEVDVMVLVLMGQRLVSLALVISELAFALERAPVNEDIEKTIK